MINLSILITCLLDHVWIVHGEVTCQSLLGVKGLKTDTALKSRSICTLHLILYPLLPKQRLVSGTLTCHIPSNELQNEYSNYVLYYRNRTVTNF